MPAADSDGKIAMLQAELDRLAEVLEPPEKEETWEKFEKALIRFAGVTRGGGYKHVDVFVRGVGPKGVGPRIVDCMLSDRGRLSGVATELLQTLAPRLAHHFAPLIQLYIPALVRLLARPNKVYLKRSEKCLATIISHCLLPPLLTPIRFGLDDKNDQCKRACAGGIERAVLEWANDLWTEKDVQGLEAAVRKMATDRDAEVRKIGKRVWGLFATAWPERVEDFTSPLTPTIRRYLDIASSDGATKAKAGRPPPRPAPALSASASAGPSRPVHNRIHALGGKPGDAAGAKAADMPVADLQRTHRTPAYRPDTRVAAPTAALPAMPAGPSRPFAAHARSASHNNVGDMATVDYTRVDRVNALSRPMRLPPSASMAILPFEPAEAPRRLPPASRIIPLPLPLDRDTDALSHGASRLATSTMGLGRGIPLGGPAQRRVVTAPSAYEPPVIHASASTTPARPPPIGRSVKERVKDMEFDLELRASPSPTHASSLMRRDPASVPLPPGSPIDSPAARRVAAPTAASSPLLPVLAGNGGATAMQTYDSTEEAIGDESDRAQEPRRTGRAHVQSSMPDNDADTERHTASISDSGPDADDVTGPNSTTSIDYCNQADDGTVASPPNLPEPSPLLPVLAEGRSIMPEPVVYHSSALRHSVELQIDGTARVPNEEGLRPTAAALNVVSGDATLNDNATSIGNAGGAAAVDTQHDTMVMSLPLAPEPDTVLDEVHMSSEHQSERSAASIPAQPPMSGRVTPATTTGTPAYDSSESKTLAPVKVDTRAPVEGVSRSRIVSSATNATSSSRHAASAPRKPPIPPRVNRAVSGPAERVSFRPVSKTAASPVKASKSRAATTAGALPSARPKLVPVPSAPAVNAAPIAKVATALPSVPHLSSTTSAPLPKPGAGYVSNLTKPTAATAARSASSSQPKPPSVKATLHRVASSATIRAQVTLPPVKRERVQVKPPLPSFRPGPRKASASGGSGPAAARVPSAASSRAPSRSGLARVRPEAIALPSSPVPKAALEVPLPASPVPTAAQVASDKPLKARVKPASIAIPPSPGALRPDGGLNLFSPKSPLPKSPLVSSLPDVPAAAERTAPQSPTTTRSTRSRNSTCVSTHTDRSQGSPIIVAPPQPLSPLLISLNSSELPPSPPAMSSSRFLMTSSASPTPSAATPVNQVVTGHLTTPVPVEKSDRPPSTLPPASDRDDTDDEDDLQDMSLMPLSPSAVRPARQVSLASNSDADLIAFSAPTRSHPPPATVTRHDVSTPAESAEAALKAAASPATPNLSPAERKVLTPRDANTARLVEYEV